MQLAALVALYDAKEGTSYKLGINKRMLELFEAQGFAAHRSRPSTLVGSKGKTIWYITARGEREVLASGRRFIPLTTASE